MRTNDFEVSFTDCMESVPACRVTVLRVPEPSEYVAATRLPLSYFPDQEAVARHIAIGEVSKGAQDTPLYGIHAQRVYRSAERGAMSAEGLMVLWMLLAMAALGLALLPVLQAVSLADAFPK